MFFRKPEPKPPTFAERLQTLRDAGFQVTHRPDESYRVVRDGCGAIVREIAGRGIQVDQSGWMVGGDVALLVDAGFQKFWRVGDRRLPALSSHLQALHAFEEDLREALGLESLFNTSLGTTNDLHIYDRLEGHGRGCTSRPWQR